MLYAMLSGWRAKAPANVGTCYLANICNFNVTSGIVSNTSSEWLSRIDSYQYGSSYPEGGQRATQPVLFLKAKACAALVERTALVVARVDNSPKVVAV